jgi:DNA-binding MarR family transcriptional regulator
VTDREHRRKAAAVLSALRDARIELAALNHQAGSKVELKDIDFECLDVIARHGPIGPTALARRVGVHAATLTGILNRLEEGEWIVRDRVEGDRRAVTVTTTPQGQRQIYAVFGGMNTRMGEVCDRFTAEQLDTIADFLHRTIEAGRASSEEIA